MVAATEGPPAAPWDALWAALEELGDARRDRELAAEAGLNEHELRYRDWWVEVCEGRAAAARDGCAALLLLLLRCALAGSYPELRRLAAAAGLVGEGRRLTAEAEQSRRETWALATAVAALEQRVAELETATDARTAARPEPADRPRPPAPAGPGGPGPAVGGPG